MRFIDACISKLSLRTVVTVLAAAGLVLATPPGSNTPYAQSGPIEQNRAVKQSAAALYKRAESRIRQQRYDDALKIIDDAISRYPESGVFVSGVLTEPYYPYYLLGLIHLEQGRFDDAINAFLEEERRGQIQYDAETYETMNLRLARARQTDKRAVESAMARA